MTLNLKAKIYTDEDAARRHLEKIQWPDGPVCPHCGCLEVATKLKGKSTRPGVYKCRACEKPYSVTVGTVFERSHVPLTKWLLATELLTTSKKGISAHQLHRMLGVTYKTAWFMAHRIREAMNPGDLPVPFGSNGGAVEVDETFIGRAAGTKVGPSYHHKMKVVALVDRETGQAKSTVVKEIVLAELGPVMRKNISKKARLMTDEARIYRAIGREFADHQAVCHGKGEYVRGDASTNTVEGFFSIFKRGMIGTYQHCSEAHLHRYLAEFDFRYSNRSKLGIDDTMRAEIALAGIPGKRLTYRRTVQA